MSISKASFRNIESLRTWFFQNQKPYWSLYTGFSKEAKDLSIKNSAYSELDRSWEMLEQIITSKMENGGRLTLYVTEKANSSHGFTEYLDFPGSANSAISGTYQSSMFPSIGNIEKYVADQLTMDRQNRKIEDLEARLNEKEQGSGISKVFNKVLEEAPIAELLMALCHKFLGSQPQMAVNGPPHHDQAFESEELPAEEQQRIADALTRISVHFPDLAGFVEKLAGFIEKNPAMAKTIFENNKL